MLSRKTHGATVVVANEGSRRVDLGEPTTTKAAKYSPKPLTVGSEPTIPAPPKTVGAVLSSVRAERRPISDIQSIILRIARTLSTLQRIQGKARSTVINQSVNPVGTGHKDNVTTLPALKSNLAEGRKHQNNCADDVPSNLSNRCESHSNDLHSGGVVAPTPKSSDNPMHLVRCRPYVSGRSAAVVRFVDTVSKTEGVHVDTRDASKVALKNDNLRDTRESTEEKNVDERGDDTTHQEELLSEKKALTTAGVWRSRFKQRLMVDSFGRLYVPGWRKNNATERRVFDAIDRAFSCLTPFGRVYSMSRLSRSRNDCGQSRETAEAATQSETIRMTHCWRREHSCPPRNRVRQPSKLVIPHRTTSLDMISTGQRKIVRLPDGDGTCPDGAARVLSDDSASSHKDKMLRRRNTCSRIPRLDRSRGRERHRSKLSDVKNNNEQSSSRSCGNLVKTDTWDDFINDMFNVHSCILIDANVDAS